MEPKGTDTGKTMPGITTGTAGKAPPITAAEAIAREAADDAAAAAAGGVEAGAEGSEGVEEPGAEALPGAKGKAKPRTPAQRIAELNTDNRKLALENARLSGIAEGFKQARGEGTGSGTAKSAEDPAAAKAGADPRPKYEDFLKEENPSEALAVALGSWSARQEFGRLRAAEAETDKVAQTQQTREALVDGFRENCAAFAVEHEDFAEVVGAAEDLELSALGTEALLTSEVAGAVTYHLAQHPEEMAKLVALPPPQQVRALGRLEARLAPGDGGGAGNGGDGDEPGVEVPTPPARKPIKPLRGAAGAGPVDMRRLAETDSAAYIEELNRKELAKHKSARAK
jgi:hypothetical protein